MHDNNRHDQEREKIMQDKKSMQRIITNAEISTQPDDHIMADNWRGTEQTRDHLRPPVRQLSPWQQIAHECRRH